MFCKKMLLEAFVLKVLVRAPPEKEMLFFLCLFCKSFEMALLYRDVVNCMAYLHV